MPQIEFYKSSNGDSWYLVLNEMGHVYVAQEQNEGSGGKGAAIGIGEFLSAGKTGPEHDALLRMIGSLVNVGQKGPG